ncbi:MAG TPA: rhodanese-like domain-containing protein [Virgibacillus sp.]|nr:rhodanese-like domain-containing protein [Virgibacillus sp.]
MEHIKEVTQQALRDRLKNDDNIVIVDVREDEEVANGMIENAKHIPLEKIPHSIDALDKSKEYVFVCRSGGRSMTAAAFMDEHGFKVSNLKGGMSEWTGDVVL